MEALISTNGRESTGPCTDCNGCVACGETHCIYYSWGNPENCTRQVCMHCVTFVRRQRLFLNNVG